MKKIKNMTAMIFLVVFCILSGCEKSSAYAVPIEDANNYNRGTWSFDAVMKTDSGYYYRNRSARYEYHYYDNETKKDVYLCSRPECLHDFDEFCTATNDTYYVNGNILYGGKIYITAYDMTEENTIKFILLRLDEDGSNLTKLSELKNISSKEYNPVNTSELVIHRGVCISSYALKTDEKIDYGTIIYNLQTGEIKELEEYAFDNKTRYTFQFLPRDRFIGIGDYIYYNEPRPEGKIYKTFICRYNIEDSSIEEVPRPTGYKGNYAVTEDNMVVLFDVDGNRWTYDWSDKGLEQHKKEKVALKGKNDEYTFHPVILGVPGSDFVAYKDKFILMNKIGINETFHSFDFGYDDGYLVVMDRDFNRLNVIEGSIIVEALKEAEGLNENSVSDEIVVGQLSIIDDELYIQMRTSKNFTNKLYKMTMSDFLEGKCNLEKVF